MSEIKQGVDVLIILSRLKDALGVKTDNQLARELGIIPTALSNWKSRGSIDYERVISICNDRGINPEWLINGVGVRYSDGRVDADNPLRRIFYVKRNPEIKTSKGHHLEVCIDRFIDVDIYRANTNKEVYIFEAYDHTMMPDIINGDRVIFQFADDIEIKEYITNNKIVLFEHSETRSHYFRRVAIRQSTGEVVLCTNDPDFHVFRLTEGMIVGIVQGVIRIIH